MNRQSPVKIILDICLHLYKWIGFPSCANSLLVFSHNKHQDSSLLLGRPHMKWYCWCYSKLEYRWGTLTVCCSCCMCSNSSLPSKYHQWYSFLLSVSWTVNQGNLKVFLWSHAANTDFSFRHENGLNKILQETVKKKKKSINKIR